MEPKFVSDVQFDYQAFIEICDYLKPRRNKLVQIAALALLCGILIFYAAAEPQRLKWICVGLLIGMVIPKLTNWDAAAVYRKKFGEVGTVFRRNLVYISDAGIRFWNPETDNRLEVAFSEVRAISKTKRFLILTTEAAPYLINHSNLTGGTARELEAFLLERCNAEKIEQKYGTGFLRRITVWFVAAAFCWSFFGVYQGFQPSPKVMTHQDAAAVLEELGIEVPEDEFTEELEQYGAGDWAVLNVLYYAGEGAYDYDTWEWTPPESGVYTFDVEVFDVGAMYTNFLRGVEGASRGALEFSDITEDDSGVDFENGTGHKTVTFTYNGQEHTFRPTVMNDWFDVDFANDLAKLVGKAEDGRRMYFLYDGYQVVSIFYCDAAWAREFARATGYKLTTRFQ